jgi:hypothetical protein
MSSFCAVPAWLGCEREGLNTAKIGRDIGLMGVEVRNQFLQYHAVGKFNLYFPECIQLYGDTTSNL